MGVNAASKATLTRAEVAARLGISTSSVRRLEGVHLHPVQDDRGTWRFDSAELDRVPRRAQLQRNASRRRNAPSAGQIAARVFRMLEAGEGLNEIVIAARQPPALVRQLHREWLISLEQGERDRQVRERNRQTRERARLAREERERERREHAEDERAHLEWMKSVAP